MGQQGVGNGGTVVINRAIPGKTVARHSKSVAIHHRQDVQMERHHAVAQQWRRGVQVVGQDTCGDVSGMDDGAAPGIAGIKGGLAHGVIDIGVIDRINREVEGYNTVAPNAVDKGVVIEAGKGVACARLRP